MASTGSPWHCYPGSRSGWAFGLTLGLRYGLAIGITCPIWFGITLVASGWTRYHVTVMIIAVRQQGPLRFGVFLDWAQQAGLLRVSGVAYQLRHRQLQDWLTSRPMTTEGTAARDNDDA